MEFWRASAPRVKKGPFKCRPASPARRRKEGRDKNRTGGTGQPCSTPTSDLGIKTSTSKGRIIYSNASKQSTDNDTSMSGEGCFWKRRPSGGHVPTAPSLFLQGETRKRQERRKFTAKLSNSAALSPWLDPGVNVSASWWCTQMKGGGRPFEILLKSKLPFHFNCSQEAESGAAANCSGHIVIYCV